MNNLIILSAGEGKRLKPFTENIPKSLVEVNNKIIIFNIIDFFLENNISDIHIINGFKGDILKEEIEKKYSYSPSYSINFIHNPVYDKTNNMYSLWLAKDILEQGTYLVEGDLLFDREGLGQKIPKEEKSCWFADNFQPHHDGCRLTADDKGKIIGIDIIPKGSCEAIRKKHFKSAGMLKIDSVTGKQLSHWLDEEVERENTGIYYDLVLAKHIREAEIYINNINPVPWIEIDTPQDLETASRIFK